MAFDIDSLTEAELRELRHQISERLDLLQQLRTLDAMAQFRPGDRVSFNANGERVVGTLVKRNIKSVTVVTDAGTRWNVSPGLLERVKEGKPAVRVNVRPAAPRTESRGSLPFPRGEEVG